MKKTNNAKTAVLSLTNLLAIIGIILIGIIGLNLAAALQIEQQDFFNLEEAVR